MHIDAFWKFAGIDLGELLRKIQHQPAKVDEIHVQIAMEMEIAFKFVELHPAQRTETDDKFIFNS